jgi:hypothetical protein
MVHRVVCYTNIFIDSLQWYVSGVGGMSSLCFGSERQNKKLTILSQDQVVNVVLETISGVFSEPRG